MSELPVDGAVLGHARNAQLAIRLDPTAVYTDATSYAAGERHLLAVTPTGAIGRRVMQINDVHDHLDLLHALRRLARRTDETGLLLRSALIVEVCELIERAIGPPARARPGWDGTPLIELVDARRGEHGYGLLEQLANRVIPNVTRFNLRDLRSCVAAHMDRRLTFAEIRDTLEAASVDDLLSVADTTLDWLDAAACSHVDLELLVLGHRRLTSLEPARRPAVPAPLAPEEHTDFLDRPFAAMVGSGFGPVTSARIAGVVAGRAQNRRVRWRSISPQSPADTQGAPGI